MEEVWAPIPSFDGYSVSTHGRFRNDRFHRILKVSPNQSGLSTVGLVLAGTHTQHRLSAKRIVASAFCPKMSDDADTPILLDGDNTNLRADNIVWRTRWFASAYAYQWKLRRPWFTVGPVADRQGNEWPTIEDAARALGALCVHVMLSAHNGTMVYPTGEVMHFVRRN